MRQLAQVLAGWPAVAGIALLAALWIAVEVRPEHVRFVDIIGFSRRAQEISEGTGQRDGLYPLGYPLLLWAGHTLFGSVLAAARLLSGALAVALVAVVTRRMGLVAGLWLLGQVPLLQWARTEGTDLPAAALSLGALMVAERPVLAGLLLGGAIATRWTALAWVPALLLAVRPGTRARTLAATTLATLPHWIAGFATGSVLLPEQSMNLAIAMGPAEAGPRPLAPGAAGPPGFGTLALDMLGRLPAGLVRALPHALPDWPARIGSAALIAGAAWPGAGQREGRLARALLAGAVLHVLAVAAVFSNPRLCLPATLACALGLPLLLATRGAAGRLAAFAAAVGLLLLRSTEAPRKLPEWQSARDVASLLVGVGGPVLANSAWVYTERDGWLVPGIGLGGLFVHPRTTPAELATLAASHADLLVLDVLRTQRETPGLAALVPTGSAAPQRVDGWEFTGRRGRWIAWRLNTRDGSNRPAR